MPGLPARLRRRYPDTLQYAATQSKPLARKPKPGGLSALNAAVKPSILTDYVMEYKELGDKIIENCLGRQDATRGEPNADSD